eukprot:7044803-Alexandrium_andersonii.AAC.1
MAPGANSNNLVPVICTRRGPWIRHVLPARANWRSTGKNPVALASLKSREGCLLAIHCVVDPCSVAYNIVWVSFRPLVCSARALSALVVSVGTCDPRQRARSTI